MKRQESNLLRRIIIVASIAIGVFTGRSETLVWDPNPEPNIAGYRVYYGETNTTPAIIDVGNVTSKTFTNLIAGRTYSFSVRAYNTAGLESSPSLSLIYTKPPASNQPPTISTIANQTIVEDSATSTVSFTVGDPNTPLSSLVLSASSSNQVLISNSSFAFGGSGTNRTLSFRPQPDQSGSTIVTVTVSDGQASANRSFTVNVTAVNDAPTISDVSNKTIAMNGTTGSLPVTISDKETAGSSLTLTAQSSNQTLIPQSGLVLGGSGTSRTISVTPTANQSGQATITLTVSDGAATASDTFLVTVTAPNQAPAVQITSPTNNASFTAPATIVINANASDPDGTVARVDFYNGSTLLGSDTNSPYSFTMSGAGAASYALTARAFDNSGASATSGVVNVTVGNPQNQPPTISTIANQTILEDSATSTVSFTVGDPNTPLSNLVLSASSSNQVLISNSSFAFGGSGTNRTLSFRPQPDQSGGAVVTVTVSDGQASANRSFTVTVTAVNDAPTISDVSNKTIAMNGTSGSLPVTISDKETAVASLTLTAQSSNQTLIPQSGLVLGGSGTSRTISVTPASNQSGQATVTLTVSDGAATASDTFVVTVTAPNRAPTVQITSPTNNASFTAPATIAINANASDPDGTVARVDFYNGGTLLGSDTNSPYSVTINNVGAGSIALTARVTDNLGLTATSSIVTVNVSAPTPTYTLNSNWLNIPVATQTGTFTAQFDATPSGGAMDAMIGFSTGGASDDRALATTVRFNSSGYIDARDWQSYRAGSQIRYAPNVKYRFRLVVNIPRATYSIFVTPSGGSELVVGSNYRFRVSQRRVIQLNNLAGRAASGGTVQLSGLTVTAGSTLSSLAAVGEPFQPFILNERFEGPGYENPDWFEVGDPDQAFQTQSMEGSFSLNTSYGTQSFREFGGVTGINVAFALSWQELTSSHTIVDLSDLGGQPAGFLWFANGQIRISHGDASASFPFIPELGQRYFLWLEWTAVTPASGSMRFYLSNSELKPAVPSAFINSGTGTAVDRVYFGGATPDSPSLLFDNVTLSETPIGNLVP